MPVTASVSATWQMFAPTIRWIVDTVTFALGNFAETLARWARAESTGDTRALAEVLDEAFQGDDPLGFVLTKGQWLARHRTRDLVNTHFAWRVTEISVENGAGVAIGTQSQTATYLGVAVSGEFEVMVVGRHGGHTWSIVNVQISGSPAPNRSGAAAGFRRGGPTST